MIIENKDILGYIIADEIGENKITKVVVCPECLTEAELNSVTSKEVVTRDDEDTTKGTTGFCDRCNKGLW